MKSKFKQTDTVVIMTKIKHFGMHVRVLRYLVIVDCALFLKADQLRGVRLYLNLHWIFKKHI